MILFVTLVRPHLEYANQIWCTYLNKGIESTENVQREAAELVPGMSPLSYQQRLGEQNLPTQAYEKT